MTRCPDSALRYTLEESGANAMPRGLPPTTIRRTSRPSSRLTSETSRCVQLPARSHLPSGLTATALGTWPTRKTRVLRNVLVLIS